MIEEKIFGIQIDKLFDYLVVRQKGLHPNKKGDRWGIKVESW